MSGMESKTPADDALMQKARAEIALLTVIGSLSVAALLILVFTETRMDAKAAALGVVCGVVFLPAALLKGPLAARRVPGIAVTMGLVGVIAWLATQAVPWVVAGAVAAAFIGATLFYRIRASTTYRPRLMRE